MKLSCRRCGSSQLVFISEPHRGYRHGAICARCGKPLKAQDWGLDPWLEPGVNQTSGPGRGERVNGAAFSEMKSEQ